MACGVYTYIIIAIVSAYVSDTLHCSVDDCCGGCEDEMDDIIVFIHSGLSLAGDGCISSLPDSATCMSGTRRLPTLIFKFGWRIDCVIHEKRLVATKAMGHPKQVAVCPLGGGWGAGGAIRLTCFPGLRPQRPEQRLGELPSALGCRLGTSESGSRGVPLGSTPMTALANSGWTSGVAQREMSVPMGANPRGTRLATVKGALAWE